MFLFEYTKYSFLFSRTYKRLNQNHKYNITSRWLSSTPKASHFKQHNDVTIIGGGIIGNMIAYHLKTDALSIGSKLNTAGKVTIIERDSTYRYSSTCLSVGGIRQQFGLAENISMSLYGVEFLSRLNDPSHVNHSVAYKHAEETNEDIDININYRGNGYLILSSSKEGLQNLKQNNNLQKSMDIDWIDLYSPIELKNYFEWINVEDLTGASLGKEKEGFFDPYSLLSGLKKRNQLLGVEYIDGSVIGCSMDKSTKKINKIEILRNNKEKEAFSSMIYINAAGANAENIIKMCYKGLGKTNLEYPVKARKRHVFKVSTDTKHNIHPVPSTQSPLVVDPSGVYWRPEGGFGHFICGVSPESCGYEDLDYDWSDRNILEHIPVDWQLFENVIVPALYSRVPAFESLKVLSSWTGFYEYNTFDQNALIGYYGDDISNMILANGFSGHGLQHAAATGRTITDLLLHGNLNRTIDVENFSFKRVQENTKRKEIGIY